MTNETNQDKLTVKDIKAMINGLNDSCKISFVNSARGDDALIMTREKVWDRDSKTGSPTEVLWFLDFDDDYK